MHSQTSDRNEAGIQIQQQIHRRSAAVSQRTHPPGQPGSRRKLPGNKDPAAHLAGDNKQGATKRGQEAITCSSFHNGVDRVTPRNPNPTAACKLTKLRGREGERGTEARLGKDQTCNNLHQLPISQTPCPLLPHKQRMILPEEGQKAKRLGLDGTFRHKRSLIRC